MLRAKRSNWAAAVAGAVAITASQGASAVNGKIFGLDWAFSGILRADVAISTSSRPNPNNQFGNPYNEITTERTSGNPDLGILVESPGQVLSANPIATGALGLLGLAPADLNLDDATAALGLPAALGTADPYMIDLVTDTIRRGCSPNQSEAVCSGQDVKQNTFNYQVIRTDLDFDLNLTDNLRFVMRARALYNVADFEDTYEREKDFDTGFPGAMTQGGAYRGGNQTYAGRPSQFEYQTVDDNNPLLFEWAGRDWFVDLPALLFEYNSGSLTMRLGNQQIAWGQTIFFRILDKVDGLDLRRHLIIDRALEEFSDERVPAPGLRTTYQITNDVLVDTFVQQFRPRIYPNTNTPYNLIPSQFTVQDRYTLGEYDEEVNYGVRLKGDYGTFGWQAIYVRRYNPAGVFSWTESNVVRPLPDTNPDGTPNVLGAALGQYCAAAYGDPGCAVTLSGTPFEVASSGQAVASGDEFVYFGTQANLDALTAVEQAVRDFPSSQLLLTDADIATGDIERDHLSLQRQLDVFFQASGGLRGHIDREYYRENVYGLGASYVTTADSGSFFNQIIVNLEAAYTPDKAFTNINLGAEPIIDDEFEIAIVMEKYHRFTNSFPATYMVFQALHRSASDIFDFYLSGYGRDDRKTGTTGSSSDLSKAPSSAQYIALAALQPWPQFIHEFSVAMLIDVAGGVLIQPGYRWKPQGNLTFELFYNFIDGDTWGDQPTDNRLNALDFADEATLRMSYQF